MRIQQVGIKEVFASLHSSPQGLTQQEAELRLAEYGPNAVEEVRRTSWWGMLLRQFTYFFALILWVAAALAFFADHQQPGEGMGTLGWAILGVILINGFFSFWQEYRAERAIAALHRLLPRQAKVIREGVLHLLPAETLVPGDLILLQEGDEVPADARLVEARSLRVNLATLTGESLPQGREAAPCVEEDPLRARNLVFAGTAVVAGEGKAVVFATGMSTAFGAIARLTQAVETAPTPLQREIARLSRIIAVFSVALGVTFYFIDRSLGWPFWDSFLFAIGVIVANVPEGLLPTVTLALAMATQRMARRNALVRHLPAVETLGSATVICTDKTGTLTLNRMAVRRVFCDGRLWSPEELEARREMLQRHRRLFEDALLCQALHEREERGERRWLGDPMEAALVELARRFLGESFEAAKIDEVPFDASRRRMTTVHRLDDGPILFCKGAFEAILPLCDKVETASGVEPLDEAQRETFEQALVAMAEEGLRVLAFAWCPAQEGVPAADQENGFILTGLMGLEDPPRPEVPVAIATCRRAGIKVIMLTGDHPRTAVAIARRIGLVQGERPRVILGEELRRMTEAQLRLALDAKEIVFARLGPDQKMHIVTALKKKRHVVAVTGDGVNDAPALRAADVGIAMGSSGTDVAKEAADVVLLDDNFATIVAAIEEGRAVFANLRKFLTYLLTSNVPELVPCLAFAVFHVPLPLTVIQMLAVDLGTDLLPALGLGAERPEPDCMSRPPRRRNERLIDASLLLRVYGLLGPMEAVAAMAAYFFVLWRGGWHWGEALAVGEPLYLQATAACLSGIVAMQVANVFVCKSPQRPLWQVPLADNPWILTGVAVEVAAIVAIDYTSWGNAIFGTAPLPWEVWALMPPFALALVLLDEVRKRLRLRRSRRQPL